jgi:hypothetical protein
MHDLLIEFIREYQMRVREAALLLQTNKGLDSPMYWRQAGIEQMGFLDTERQIPYQFHGSGCRVGLPSGEVDWDFGYDGRLDGLNPWFLWCFAQEGTDNFPEFMNKVSLDEAVSAAVSQGLIHRPFMALQDNLYYLHEGVSQNKNFR